QLKETLSLPPVGENLFLDLMERIAQVLNISDSWICRGALTTELWPWKGISLSVPEILLQLPKPQQWNKTKISREHRPEGWMLNSGVIGEECIGREG
ncbi:ENR1 protein, partial [Chaetorhynchus papuensis]|nr:ENR1 protein [Chaetorhynchus papuensis]